MAVTDEAIMKIKQMIVTGQLHPGDRLPPEKDLSESLGLSRSSLREAVKALEVIRVLDVRRGDGTYVSTLEPQVLLEAMTFVLELQDDRAVFDILEVRRILEPAAAGLAATRFLDSHRVELERMIASVSEDSSVEDLVTHDLEFHRYISGIGGNSYLSTLIDGCSSQTVRARIWRGLTQDGAVHSTLIEHQRILAALQAGDAQLSTALTLVHVNGVEEWLRGSVVASP